MVSTMINCRPRKPAIASQAPMGAPISSATMLAVRQTRRDSATMPRTSGSASPISDRAALTDRAKSFIRPCASVPTECLHVGENRVSGEFERLDGPMSRLGVPAAAGVLHDDGNNAEVGGVPGRGFDPDFHGDRRDNLAARTRC